MKSCFCLLPGLLFAHVLLAADNPVLPDNEDVVTMDVVATGVGLDVDKAKQNALSAAVEHVVGVHVQAETLVENDELREKVLTYTAGDVKAARILGTPWQQDGLTYVRVSASVVVDRSVRGHRYGTRLCGAVVARLLRAGAPVVSLAMMTDNRAAAALYRSLGFATGPSFVSGTIPGRRGLPQVPGWHAPIGGRP